MTDTAVAEGHVKFRDGKKWKTRWVSLRKPSPVADCLTLLVLKEKKGKSSPERLSITLEGICGVEPGPGYDGVSYCLCILCPEQTLQLGFSRRDALLAWDARVRLSLGEVHRFSVGIEPGTSLERGPARLQLCNGLLVLIRGRPPALLGLWRLSALRRYGAVPKGFVFEGGTRCGVSDLEADAAQVERRISLETSDLEKRLSSLSRCSLASSASTYSWTTSVAGDDRSLSSSSSSQSDASYGSRRPFWAEPPARPQLLSSSGSSPPPPPGPAPSGRPATVRLRPRGLHSSLDSGIGIGIGIGNAAGSLSSGSLDMAGGGEELGPAPPSLPPCPPPPEPPPPSPLSPLQAAQTVVRLPPESAPGPEPPGGGGAPPIQAGGAPPPRPRPWGGVRAPPVDAEGVAAPGPPPASGLFGFGETQINPDGQNYVVPEQLWALTARCLTPAGSSPPADLSPACEDQQEGHLHLAAMETAQRGGAGPVDRLIQLENELRDPHNRPAQPPGASLPPE
ncbi:protein Dok-7 [Menidia menidia]